MPVPTTTAPHRSIASGIVCIDGCRPSPLAPGWIVHGWFLAGRPIRHLVLECDGGDVHPVWFGIARPDVGQAHPSHPRGSRAGFLVLVKPGASASPTPPPGRWWYQDETGDWRTVPVAWQSRTPERFTPAAVGDSPSEKILAATHGLDDPEARLQLGLAASRGLTLRLDITNKCNLRCVMCHYQRDDVFQRPARFVTTEQFAQWFTDVSAIVGDVMLSCADEPLTSRFFSDIVRLIRRLRPAVEIKFCTNAMLMTAPIQRLLVEQQVDLVVFSLDGCTRSTFESIRTGARFDRVVGHLLALEQLRRLAGSRLPEIVLNYVMMRRNLHEARPFITLARRAGASSVDYRHVVASYEGFNLQDQQLKNSPGRYNFYREQLLEEGRRQGLKLYLPPPYDSTPPWRPGADEPVAGLEDFEQVAGRLAPVAIGEPLQLAGRGDGLPGWMQLHELFADTFCARPFSEIMIREQEEIMPCPWHARPLGRLDKTPNLLDAFFGDEFRALRRNMLLPHGDTHCRSCPLKANELPSELSS